MNNAGHRLILLIIITILASVSCSLKSGMHSENEETRRQIRGYTDEYSSENWGVRIAAVKKASKYADTIHARDILPLMLLASDDYHPLIQIEAVKSLRKMKSYAAIEKLRELALTEPDLNVRRASITALQDYSLPGNADIFIAGTESRDWLIREASYIGLLKIKPEETQRRFTGRILKGMRDPNLSVKIAVLTNVKIKDPLLYNEISGLINDKKSGASLLKGALTAVNGYILDDKTRKRILDLLTHRNKDVRLLSLQALKREKIEQSF